MFLSTIDARQKTAGQRFKEIRQVLEKLPVPTQSSSGVTYGLRATFELRDRLVQVMSRHQLSSVKETIYKALMLGLLTLERLPPQQNGMASRINSKGDWYKRHGLRVLDEEEVGRLRDEGWNAPRKKPEESIYEH